MKNLALAVALLLGTSAFVEVAAKEPSAKQLAQRQRMKDCAAEAKGKGLKKQERKDFMKTCLSSGKASAEVAPAASTAAAPAPVKK
jgi:hypothetical protein